MANKGCFVKGEKRPGQGRPKGAVSKVTQSAKEAIALAAESLGGAERMVEWAKEDPANERVFWGTIYPKLLPLQVAGDPDNPLKMDLSLNVVFRKPK
jgi:hypothetical protein